MSTPRTAPQTPARAGASYTLHPGDVVCAERGDTLETLLGSCVAVILTDRRRTIGAMCHIVHHRQPVGKPECRTHFADGAIDHMYRLLSACGMTPRLCDAFVYGGGDMFPEVADKMRVGDRNGESVVVRLTRDGVRMISTDLGGRSYRRLRWTVGFALPHVTATSV